MFLHVSYLDHKAFPIKKSSARYSEKAASPPTSSRQFLLSSQDMPLAQFCPSQLATRYTRECCVPKYTWPSGGSRVSVSTGTEC